MKKILLAFLLTIACLTFTFSQKKIELNGDWQLDKTNSAIYIAGIEQMDRNFKNDVFNCDVKLTIEYNEPELKIKQNSDCEEKTGKKMYENAFSYYTDSRGETNTFSSGISALTMTKLDGNKIVITSYTLDNKGKKKIESIRKFSISKQGDKLTEIITHPDSAVSDAFFNGKSFTKKVYRKSN